MSDLISRQAAIDAIVKCTNCNTPKDLREYVAEHSLWSLWSGGVLEALEAVEGLPSAEPERKKGKWIDYSSEGFVECPFCHSATNCDDNKDELHYCFSCGADMRGEQE